MAHLAAFRVRTQDLARRGDTFSPPRFPPGATMNCPNLQMNSVVKPFESRNVGRGVCTRDQLLMHGEQLFAF